MTDMDMCGGLSPERDWLFGAAPANPEMRESVSMWVFDESGAFGFPRIGIEAEGALWSDRLFQANIAFSDGRVLIGPGRGAAPPTAGPDGHPTVFGAGPLRFHCVEPFRRWSASFDGTAADGHVEQQMARTLDPNRRTPVRFSLQMTMAVPPWIQGTLLAQAAERLSGIEGGFMGGFRYEQLFRAQGNFEVDGLSRPFKGTGLRIHRQGVRQLEGFRGHCWQSAVFPSGRAFGYIAYPPRADGTDSYNEGFLFVEGRMIPARVVRAPWLKRLLARGDDVGLEFESALGCTVIEGETVLSTFRVGNPDMGGLTLQQTGVLYRWDGESAYGMLERSAGSISIGTPL